MQFDDNDSNGWFGVFLANPTHGENSYWYIIRKSCVECRITISNHLFSKYAGLILLVFLSGFSFWHPNYLDATYLQPFDGVEIVSLNDVRLFHKHWKKWFHEWSKRGLFVLHVFTIIKFVYLYLHTGYFSKMSSYIWAFLRTPNVRSPLFPIFYDIQAFKSWAI